MLQTTWGHAVRRVDDRTKETTCFVQSYATRSGRACRQDTRGALIPRLGTLAEGRAQLHEVSGLFLECPADRLGIVGEPAPQRSLVTEVATFYDDRMPRERSGHNDARVRTTQPRSVGSESPKDTKKNTTMVSTIFGAELRAIDHGRGCAATRSA